MKLVFCVLIMSALLIAFAAKSSKNKLRRESTKIPQTNLLFIAFDDLRPELAAYGKKNMITPNFDRLAARSVLFDHAYCQISVCNPSRDSFMTGLRPDTTGTYGFQSSFRPHMTFPAVLTNYGYKTAAYGKIFHWETGKNERGIWNYDQYDGNWYNYQHKELSFMNSSTTPDRNLPEESFRDYIFTSRAIDTIKKLRSTEPDANFMVALGFKLPHLAVHVPYKYFDMYRGKVNDWKRVPKELTFPKSSPTIAYKCCANPSFEYMNEEGTKPSTKKVKLGEFIDYQLPQDMHNELMWGYAAAITFLDTQLGRLLDTIDELQLWNNLTVVLTSDHGIHNGEKGIWEKWTMFDESLRVPLMISHPKSPFMGSHYRQPVELIDIFPTLVDLLHIPIDRPCKHIDGMVECHPLQGKSLAKVVLGDMSMDVTARNNSIPAVLEMPELAMKVALSQSWRCGNKQKLMKDADNPKDRHRRNGWAECNKVEEDISKEISSMGYSLRSNEFRYTIWFQYDRPKALPLFDLPPIAEELYDHRGEVLEDFTHQEYHNVVHRSGYEDISVQMKQTLINFLKKEMIFRGAFTG